MATSTHSAVQQLASSNHVQQLLQQPAGNAVRMLLLLLVNRKHLWQASLGCVAGVQQNVAGVQQNGLAAGDCSSMTCTCEEHVMPTHFKAA